MEPQSLFSVAMQERPIKTVDPTAERNLSEQIAEQIGERIIRGQLPYVNMGNSYEALGDNVNAEKFYSLAAELGVVHQD
jgi:hypothetical protein